MEHEKRNQEKDEWLESTCNVKEPEVPQRKRKTPTKKTLKQALFSVAPIPSAEQSAEEQQPAETTSTSIHVGGIDVGTRQLSAARIVMLPQHSLPFDVLNWVVVDMGPNLNQQHTILDACVAASTEHLQFYHTDTNEIAIESQPIEFADQQGNRYMQHAADGLYSSLRVLTSKDTKIVFQSGSVKRTAVPPQVMTLSPSPFVPARVWEECVAKYAHLTQKSLRDRKANKLFAIRLVDAIMRLFQQARPRLCAWWSALPKRVKADAADALLHAYARGRKLLGMTLLQRQQHRQTCNVAQKADVKLFQHHV